jgi:DNA-binding transcriptional LysR family regulator
LRLSEIAHEPLIVFDRSFSSGLHDKIAELYRKQGFTPHLTVTHAEAHEEAGTIMVAAGKGIYIGVGAIVTRSVAGAELAAVRLKEPDAKIEVYAAWRKEETSTAVFAFLESVCSILRMPNKRGGSRK